MFDPSAYRPLVRSAAAGLIVAGSLLINGLTAVAQPRPNLVVEALSVHATMPNAAGERQITTSFRIVNKGAAPAGASLTSIQSAGGSTFHLTPALRRDATAFFSSTVATNAADVPITVQADVAKQLNESSENDNFAFYRFVADEAAVGRWRPLGPSVIVNGVGHPTGVGRITTIAVDPFSASTIYVGARGTGLWKTTDAGAHWEPLTDALPTANINAVVVDPTNPARVFVATPAGIFGSSDAGHVWVLLTAEDLKPQGADGGAFLVHPFHPQRLYLSTQNGLRISRDGGMTWDPPVLGAGAIIESLLQSRTAPDHLFATVVESQEAGLYEAIDGGLTPGSWRKIQGCPEGPFPTIPTSKAQLWVAQSGVTQWVSIRHSGQHELWRTSSRACLVNGRFERVWEQLSAGSTTPCIGTTGFSFLYADPADHRVLYKGGVNLCRSSDGGSNFSLVHNLHVDQHAFAFHPILPGLMFVGNDGGLYRSSDGGRTWAFNSEGLHVTEFLDLDIGGAAPRALVGGSQDNGMSSSDQSTPVWHEVDLGSDPDGDRTTAVVDPLDNDVQYTIGQAVDHFSRIKGGHRDAAFDTSNMPQGCLTYAETPSLFTNFIATNSPEWHLLITVGAGAQCGGGVWTGPPWRALFAPTDGEVFTRIVHDPLNGLFLAGGNLGSVYVNFSPDFMAKVWNAPAGSVTSIVRELGTPGSYFVSLDLGAGNVAGGRIFEITPDAPLHFKGQDITANLPAGLVMTLAMNRFEPGVLYAGTRGHGIMRGTRDSSGGWHWQTFNNGMPEGAIVTKLRVNQALGTIYAATYGRGAFAVDTISFF